MRAASAAVPARAGRLFKQAPAPAQLLKGMSSVLGGSGAAMATLLAAGVGLGALLALSPRPLYPHLHSSAGLTPLEDQHLGGAIMLLAGGASYLLGGLWLTAGLLRDRRLEPAGEGAP